MMKSGDTAALSQVMKFHPSNDAIYQTAYVSSACRYDATTTLYRLVRPAIVIVMT